MNAAFSFGSQGDGGAAGGAQLLITTIQDMTGLTIDHFVRVSMVGFYNVVEALGPVEVCLNNAVNDPYSTLDLPAGVSTLYAQQALSFVRQRRDLPNGDLGRQVRQQYFLSVEARQILSAGTLLNPIKLRLDAVSSAAETDPGLNFINLAAQMRNLSADKIVTATIPILGTPTIYVDGRALPIVEVDTEAMPGFIDTLVNGPSAYESAVAAPVGTVTVTVINARGDEGVAAATSATLVNLGFIASTPESASATEITAIQYPGGMEAAAKALSTYFPGATVTATDAVTEVTVVLGTDGLEPLSPTPAAPNAAIAPSPPINPSAESAPPGTTYAAGACVN